MMIATLTCIYLYKINNWDVRPLAAVDETVKNLLNHHVEVIASTATAAAALPVARSLNGRKIRIKLRYVDNIICC